MSTNLFLWYLPFSILLILSGNILLSAGIKDRIAAFDINCVILSMHSYTDWNSC